MVPLWSNAEEIQRLRKTEMLRVNCQLRTTCPQWEDPEESKK